MNEQPQDSRMDIKSGRPGNRTIVVSGVGGVGGYGRRKRSVLYFDSRAYGPAVQRFGRRKVTPAIHRASEMAVIVCTLWLTFVTGWPF